MLQKQPPRAVLSKTRVLKICGKFTGEHPCQSDFNKVLCIIGPRLSLAIGKDWYVWYLGFGYV